MAGARGKGSSWRAHGTVGCCMRRVMESNSGMRLAPSTENMWDCFTKSNLDFTTASGWLKRLVRLTGLASPRSCDKGIDGARNEKIRRHGPFCRQDGYCVVPGG